MDSRLLKSINGEELENNLQTNSTVSEGEDQVERPDPETGIEVESDDAADSDEVEYWKKIAKPVEDKKRKQSTELNERG